MKQELAQILVQKSIINYQNLIEVRKNHVNQWGKTQVKTKQGIFVKTIQKNNTLSFVLLELETKKPFVTTCNEITSIDGMDPTRFAKAFDLDSVGKPIPIGKKRGRKPKYPIL